MSVKETHLTGTPGSVTKYVQEEKELHQSRSGEQYTTGYYSENDRAPSLWMGKGAALQGLSGEVKASDLERALSGITTSGEDISKRGGHDKERRMGSDWTFSAPKAASIIGIEDERVKQWMMESVQETIDEYFEPEMVYARVGKGGAVSEFTGNVMFAAHLHEAARAADGTIDPQIHVHGVTPSMIQRADGQWVAARYDYGENNQKVYTLGDIQVAKLMKKMQEKGGYDLEARLEKDKDGREHLSFGAKGISREVEETFSGRKKQINEHLKSLGIDPKTATRAQKDAAAINTRAAKDKNVDAVDLKYQQRQRARDAGVDLGQMRADADKRVEQRIDAPEADLQKITGADVVKSAIQHLSERNTIFTRTDILNESVKMGAGHGVDFKDIQKALDERAGGLVRVEDRDRDETGKLEQQFTTKSEIYREAEILHRAKDGQGKADAIIPTLGIADGLQNQQVVPDVSFTQEEIENGRRSGSTAVNSEVGGFEEIEPLTQHRMRNLSERGLDADQIRKNPDLLPPDAGAGGSGTDNLRRPNDDPRVARIIKDFEKRKGFTLGDGQKAAVALALTTQDQHIGIVGAAGAGKTTAMEVIVEQYKAAGYEVVGVAPSAAAAKELESAGCDDTRTLASALLMKQEQKEGETPPKRLYIMDESGMVSAKDMDSFLRKADAEGARSILVGDPLQLAAVEAGSPYAQMLETGSIQHVKIDEIQRQKDPQLREIAQAFARGDAAQGVELARPYMTQVQATDADYKEAAVEKEKEQKSSGTDAQATEKMMKFAEDHGYKGSNSFEDVRRFLDEKAYRIGLDDAPGNAAQNPVKTPAEVRRIALARAASEAYLALSPAEREQTLLLAGTNDTRQAINEKIRDGLKAEGALSGSSVQITALDKLDLTREAATRAEKYEPKDPKNSVIVKINQEIKGKDGQIEATRGSQWRVTDNRNGKLTLESFDGQKREIVVDPAKVKLSAYESRKMDLVQGDRVMFRENNKERNVMNGQQAKIIGVDKETGNIIAETRTGERITLNPTRAEAVDYSYARTVHSSQGATVERAIVVGEASKVSTAEAAYVACSREKTGLQIITDDMEKLGKSWSKFADKQSALDASKTKSPQTYAELQKSRAEADHSLGRTGDFAKKRAAAQAAGPTLGDTAAIPDALDPDFGSDKFSEKVEEAMDKIQGKQQAASNAESAVLNTPTPASARDDEKGGSNDAPQRAEQVHEAPPPPPPETEMERELGE
ncbi:MobF family relaxase [Acidithiobacillus ferriphilus]|uniref:MobF family relaxase n=1 Tax=Acidithiobacillus ferriphilus TaxID=1689834 RepID=UPI00242F1C6B|nr:MobF family relaxase [Acidithiobacillus ferriphilus]